VKSILVFRVMLSINAFLLAAVNLLVNGA